MDQEQEIKIKLSHLSINKDPKEYKPSKALVKALEIAYALKRPLLLSGDPGTGKTDFARWVAYELSKPKADTNTVTAKDDTANTQTGQPDAANKNENDVLFHDEPIVFNTKSTSVAQDLFYFYDAVGHFREIPRVKDSLVVQKQHLAKPKRGQNDQLEMNDEKITLSHAQTEPLATTVEDFIDLRALGLAFVRAMGKKDNESLPASFLEKNDISDKSMGTVVLIDEIDKAPRDFPNDLLNELEGYEFEIKELRGTTRDKSVKIKLNDEQRKNLIIILTSNFEKNLPEPFLRRCVYFHIEFPDKDMLKEIISGRLGLDNADKVISDQLDACIEELLKLRDLPMQKRPSTAEFIDFVKAIHEEKLLGEKLFTSADLKKIPKESKLIPFLPILIKKRDDMKLLLQ